MQTAITLLLCCVPFALFAGLLTSKWRFRWFAVGLYVLVYIPLSLQGRYLTANHGGMDWQDHWAPLGLVEPSKRKHGRSSVRLSWLGTLFWPLIVLDNIIWHPTHESDLSK